MISCSRQLFLKIVLETYFVTFYFGNLKNIKSIFFSRHFGFSTNGDFDSRCESVDESEYDKLSIADSYVDNVGCCTSCEKKRRKSKEDVDYNDDCEPRTLSNFEVENLTDDEDDSLSLLDVQRDLTPFQMSDRNVGTSNYHPPPASDTLSTLSSVSSMTLQAGKLYLRFKVV